MLVVSGVLGLMIIKLIVFLEVNCVILFLLRIFRFMYLVIFVMLVFFGVINSLLYFGFCFMVYVRLCFCLLLFKIRMFIVFFVWFFFVGVLRLL